MSASNRAFKTAALAACLGLAAPSAFAQAFDAVRLYGATPGQGSGTIGLATVFGTEYAGSDERRSLVLPLLDYQWGNGWFAGTTNGIGVDLSSRPHINYGLRITADFGRKEKRSPALAGLGDIDAKPEFGGFFNYAIGRDLALTSSLRYGAGEGGDGLLLDVGAAYSIELAPRWQLGVGVAATYANARYLQSYFGITPAQSVRSAYAVYTPGAGWRDVRAHLALTYEWSPRVSVTTAVSAGRLQGDAEASPLTRRASEVSGVVAVSYSF